jgi:hypothetical protein
MAHRFDSETNWKALLTKYIKGEFKSMRRRIKKKSLARKVNGDIIPKSDERIGGESVGNIAFAIDESGSVWGQGTDTFDKFFSEITDVRRKLQKPIKGIAVFPFTSGNADFYADYFKDGVVPLAQLHTKENGGTDFSCIFKNMLAAKVYYANGPKAGQKIWRSEKDKDFPVVTVICTDGEDDVPDLSKMNPKWSFKRHCVIWIVINIDQHYPEQFKKNLIAKGYDPKYFISIKPYDI